MSYTPTPPPPPPKLSSHSFGSPRPLQHQSQSQPGSPAQLAAPPLPPYPLQQSPATAYPTRTSSWIAPYPPDDGLRRLSSDEAYTLQQPSSYQNYLQDYTTQQQQQQLQGQIPPDAHLSPPQYPQQQPQPLPLPTQLSSKSKADLAHVLATPDLLNAILHAPDTAWQQTLANSQRRLRDQLSANVALATTLQTLEATLEAARANTSTHLLRVRGLETSWKKKQGELERRLEPWGPRELHQRLGQAIAEQEGMCGALEGSFIEGDGAAGGGAEGESGVAGEREVGDWVRRVREGRRLVALRRERKGRWDEGRVGGWR